MLQLYFGFDYISFGNPPSEYFFLLAQKVALRYLKAFFFTALHSHLYLTKFIIQVL